jgi:uncharacterized protein
VSKNKIYLLGLVTLFLFPIPAFIAFHFSNNLGWQAFLQIDKFLTTHIVYGLVLGIVYALLASLILKAPIFKEIPLRIDELVKELKINYIDAIFLSLCAGIGEELLFRSGIQPFLGVWITSIFFVAIHGYFSLKNPKMSLYGLVVLPFILLISYGFDYYGLWFSVSAHFSYDLVLFIFMINQKDK